MAELTPESATASCCSAETQETCCEPDEKDSCCGTGATGSACGCSAGNAADEVRKAVHERYAAAAIIRGRKPTP